MRLKELIGVCDGGYRNDFPESSLGQYVNSRTGQPLRRMPSLGDTLALFVVRELCETFDGEASDDEQIAEATREMNAARANIDNIISVLERRLTV